MSHTPGPWVPTKESGLRWRIQTAGDRGTLAYMTARPGSHLGNFSYGQIEANARLIAAAPELLEALLGIVGCTDGTMYQTAMERARAAIAKALGK